MAVFLVTSPSDAAAMVDTVVPRVYGADTYKLSAGQWLISARASTAEHVSKSLGIGDDKNDPAISAIVVSVGSYWGHHDRDVWPWLKTQVERHFG